MIDMVYILFNRASVFLWLPEGDLLAKTFMGQINLQVYNSYLAMQKNTVVEIKLNFTASSKSGSDCHCSMPKG